MVKSLRGNLLQTIRQAPLRTILILPFVIQLVGTVSLIGYFSFKSGQRSVNTLVTQLQIKAGDRATQHLDHYLAVPQQLNQSVYDAIDLGLLDVSDFERLEQYFWRQIQTFEVSQLSYATANGEFIGVERLGNGSFLISTITPETEGKLHVYTVDEQGNRLERVAVKNWSYFSEPWYDQTVQADRPIWSSIFQWTDKPNVMSITATYPVRDASNQIVGVLSTDLSLSRINGFLDGMDISPESRVFIVERNGLIVANCKHNPNYYLKDGIAQRFMATAVDDPFIRATTTHLIQQFGSLEAISNEEVLHFWINNQRQFAHVSPWRDSFGLDWLIVITAPESDFMESIYNNTHVTILLCLMALVLALLIGIITVRWVSLPILRLNRAAKALAKGIWQTIQLERSDEVGELADSFNKMAVQLQASFAELQMLNEALEISQQQLNQILEALPVGVAVMDCDGTVIYVNQMAKQMIGITNPLGTTPANRTSLYQLYVAGTNQPYPTDRLPSVRALRGEIVTIDDMEIHRDGEIISLEMRTIPVFDPQGQISFVLTAFHDITQRKQSEKALQQSEQRFATLAKIAPVGIFRNDLEGNCLYGNDRGFEMLGLSADSSMRIGWASVLHPDDRDRVLEEWSQFLQGKRSFASEYRFLLPNGTLRWVYGQALPERDQDGNTSGYVATITDITAQKQVEEALRQSEAKFRRLAENVPGVIYRYVLHPDGSHEFTYASPGMIDLYGYPPEAIIQNPQLAWERTHPDDVESLNSTIQISAETMQSWQWEGRTIPSVGRQRWIRGSSRPERQPNGDIVWDGLLIDITDRKQAEQVLAEYNSTLEQQVYERTIALQQEIKERERIEAELREQQAFLRQVINVVPSAIFVKDQQGKFICVNQAAAAMYGVSVEALIGKTDADFNADPEQIQEFFVNNQQVMATRQPKRLATEPLLTRQGTLRWHQTIISPLIDANDEVQGIVGSSTDITDLKQVEEELRQAKEAAEAANRAKGTFLANMSHELRTPLNAILGFSQLMSYDTNLSSEQQETLEIIYCSGEHLLTLINQVLDLSKIEANSMPLNEKPFDLDHLLADLKRMFSLKAQDKGLDLKIEYINDVPDFVYADEIKLRQVLINLLSNAIKFTPRGSVWVRVRYEQQPAHFQKTLGRPSHNHRSIVDILTFDVIDTGVGIETHELEHLFQPFVQTVSGQKLQEGTGLGLSISYQFVRLMAGEIMVISKGCFFTPEATINLLNKNTDDLPSQGTTFRFAIPISIADASMLGINVAEADLNRKTPPALLNQAYSHDLKLESRGLTVGDLNSSDFKTIPPDWLTQFRQTILEGDLENANILIDQLRYSHESFANTLTYLVDRYQFEQILHVISKLDV
jgi:PAS domain S-box-containing protein